MKSVAVILAALVGLTIAAPAPDVAAADARDVRVRFFTRDHFDGREYTDEADIGECRNVPRAADDRIRSIKIDSDRARCTFYNNRNCRGDNFSPRRGTDVPVMDDEFKADISSYLCEERRREGGGGGGGGGGRDRDPPPREGERDGGRDGGRDRDRDRENDRDRGGRDRGDRDRGDRDRGRGGRP